MRYIGILRIRDVNIAQYFGLFGLESLRLPGQVVGISKTGNIDEITLNLR